jgi:hypothetical protein
LKESDHFEDGIYLINMDLKETGWEVVDWIYLAQGRTHLRLLVNTVIKLWVPYLAEQLLASEEEFCCMVLDEDNIY